MDNAQVCAVCARVLNFDSAFGWAHAYQDQPEDHPAVPVDCSEVHVQGRCDFCSEEEPTWVVPAKDFEYFSGHGSHGDWAACRTCAHAIARHDWDTVLSRAEALVPANDRADFRAGLKLLYSKLRVNLTGPPEPLTTLG